MEDYFYAAGKLVSGDRPTSYGGHRFFHLDHLGTPRMITTTSGARIALHDYEPFGEEITDSTQEVARRYDRNEPMRFTGHERDVYTSIDRYDGRYFDYMHARCYSPQLSRFLSVDPGPYDLRRPQSLNRYTYADNSPVNNIDRDGKLTNPVTKEKGRGAPILQRGGGGFGEIRKSRLE